MNKFLNNKLGLTGLPWLPSSPRGPCGPSGPCNADKYVLDTTVDNLQCKLAWKLEITYCCSVSTINTRYTLFTLKNQMYNFVNCLTATRIR